jgi:microcystin-dependent protein
MPFRGATAPDGYLMENGAAVSRQAYAELFAVIGTTYGVGDGSTTFNLPDSRNRVPIGSGGLYSLGATGGSKDAIAVAHSHTATTAITDPGHTHAVTQTQRFLTPDTNNGTGSANGPAVWGAVTLSNNAATTGITAATTVNSSGASGTDANLPPYLASNWIIKT